MAQMMKAVVTEGPGHDPVQSDIQIPQPGAGDVLVRIVAVGVGLHDRFPNQIAEAFPHAIGMEGAGVVEAVGDAVRGFRSGDRVMVSGIHAKGGTWAEYAAIDAGQVLPVPDGLSFEQAAALPIAGGTALEGVKALGVSEGDYVFIAGASGAIGSIAIQLAVRHGYHVAASASPGNHDYLRSLGAELAVDYRDDEWTDQVKTWKPGGVDAALAIQPGTGVACLAAVRDDGKIVTISGDRMWTERGIRTEQIMHHPETRSQLLQLARDAANGSVRIEIEDVYPFAKAVEALEKTETRHARGKVVVRVSPE